MTVKVKYEDGKFLPLEKVSLENHKVYEIEIKDGGNVPSQTIDELLRLQGIVSLGGDALEDTEELYAR